MAREVRRGRDDRRAAGGRVLRGADRLEEVKEARMPSEAAPPSAKLVFVGFMGAGKSRTVRNLAPRAGREALDADLLLEQRLGEPIASFFEREGEAAFRERERELVLELLDRAEPGVIALGGGAVESESVREALTTHWAARVDVDPETAWQRASGTARPLARDR